MAKLKIITVVINTEMYEKFFLKNLVLSGCDLVSIDNRQLNQGLPVIYNELIARHLTPQTKASIRIVLGTLSHFAGITPRQP